MVRFISRNPWLSLGIVIALACFLFGPATVGAWIGVHGRAAIVGVWGFVRGFFNGAF